MAEAKITINGTNLGELIREMARQIIEFHSEIADLKARVEELEKRSDREDSYRAEQCEGQ